MALKAPPAPISRCPEWLPGLSPGSVQLQKNLDLDYDLLVSNVEHSIMADRDRSMMEMTPQELLIRSNPGVFSNDRAISRDLTNPREMYNILAYKAKSNEDLAARFKQELSKSLNSPGHLPKLARTVSVNEIRRNPNQFERLGYKSFQSSQSQQATDKNLNVLVLTRHKTCIGDVRKIQQEDKENLKSLNLPSITRNAVSALNRDDVDNNESAQQKCGLPDLTDTRVKPAVVSSKRKSELKRKLSASDSKLDKWFSEMPNEVFDKAQRAIMEESIKDKLHRYQDRNKKLSVNQPANVPSGSRMRRVPNTFIEVHVDSFGKHLQNEKEDKMNKYKMQQKSMLKLKMRDIDTTMNRKEKTHDEIELTARLSLQQRSLTARALSKKQHSHVHIEPEVIQIRSAKHGLKTVNMNETVGFEMDTRYFKTNDNQGKENGDDEHAETMMPASPPPNSAVMQGNDSDGSAMERETTKATVVTIALKKEEPAKRQPFHIEKSIQMNSIENNPKIDLKTNNNDVIYINDQVVEKELPAHEDAENHEHIVTKIPTAPSTRTSDSASSSIVSGSRGNKSVLKKFNTLEVFAESNKQPEPKLPRKNYRGQKLREFKEVKDPVPPSVKLDLKHVPHHTQTMVKEVLSIERNEVRKHDVIFRFEPGEVFVTNKNNTQISHAYNNRSSERARIIYGKALGKDDKRDAYIRALENRNRVSSNTSMNIGRESRAVDGINRDRKLDSALMRISKTNIVEENRISTKNPRVNVNGVLVCDIAIETDVLGSEPNTPNDQLKLPEVANVSARSNSGLSDFIIDNNDGESLESDANGDAKTITDDEMDNDDV